MDEQFIIEARASWDDEGRRPIPSRIGPFSTRNEAEEWWALNCSPSFGEWGTAPLMYPYLRTPSATHVATPNEGESR